ncbi:MAG: nicotinate-nucleotide adenylyltransferase [Pantoea sp. Brub]|nr:nicotinate-nucleotide adenylyltransferase [Pantoea sp. Brub]
MSELYSIFGGTFNPIHFGHLYSIEILAKQLNLKNVILLPNNIPPHRLKMHISAVQRINMLKLAIKDNSLFKIDIRELNFQHPSWTVNTLENIRIDIGYKKPLAFIIGSDSLFTIHRWYRWKDIMSLCHLLVCQRSKNIFKDIRYNNNDHHKLWIKQHVTTNIQDIYQKSAGCIWLANTPLYNISSSKIRQLCYLHKPCDQLLPSSVINYINKHNLYNHLF